MKKFILFVILLIQLIIICGCSSSSVDTSISDEIGSLIKIDVYVNDIKVQTPVYKNKTAPEIDGPDNLSDFVLLEPVCKAIGATFELYDDNIKIHYKNEEYIITKFSFGMADFWVIDDIIYVSFSSIRYAMDGSLKQNDYKSMYLYTADFERLDIPATLDECYKMLDEELDAKTKRDIKKAKIDDLAEYHFGLGLWIRNNWIYPTNNRITKVFLDLGINSPDEMSGEIILGYHYYLNDVFYDITSNIQK